MFLYELANIYLQAIGVGKCCTEREREGEGEGRREGEGGGETERRERERTVGYRCEMHGLTIISVTSPSLEHLIHLPAPKCLNTLAKGCCQAIGVCRER